MESSRSPPITLNKDMSVTTCMAELEKLSQKLQRAYKRRDHYAQLYYRTVAELEDTKWELDVAKNKIKELQSPALQGQSTSNIDTTVPLSTTAHTKEQTVTTPLINGHISPDSGSISISPSSESLEGNQVPTDDESKSTTSVTPPNDIPPREKIVKSNSKSSDLNEHSNQDHIKSNTHNPNESIVRSNSKSSALNEHANQNHIKLNTHNPNESIVRSNSKSSALNEHANQSNHTQPNQPVKRVAFTDNPPPVIYQQHSEQDWMANQPIAVHRSYSIAEGRQNGYQPMRVQRTQSYSYRKVMHPQAQFSTYPVKCQHPVTIPVNGAPFSLSYDHRLPRVHRGLAYETSVPVGPGYQPSPHIQPPPPPSSAFKRVPVPNYPNDYRGQPHYSSLPMRSAPPLHKSVQIDSITGGKWKYRGLDRVQLMHLFNQISNPKADVKRLEISASSLGDLEMMALLCKELKKKQTIEELSLPNNGIRKDSLKLLLDTVRSCRNIKHLKLANNDINYSCLTIIQDFLEKTSLCSVILTGNEIEHHTHLLQQPLPQDVCEEYGTTSSEHGPGTSYSSSQHMIPTHSYPVTKSNASSSLPHNVKLHHI